MQLILAEQLLLLFLDDEKGSDQASKGRAAACRGGRRGRRGGQGGRRHGQGDPGRGDRIDDRGDRRDGRHVRLVAALVGTTISRGVVSASQAIGGEERPTWQTLYVSP
jgi:hypothetical protein